MISSSANLITGARQMATRVGEMVQDIDEKDRRRLLRVQRRIECLIQPLNFCVMVSQRRGPSHCDPVIESVSNLIQKVCDYLRNKKSESQQNLSQKMASSIGGAMAGEESDFSKQLDRFLEELDFAAISLNMIISTAPYMSTHTTSQPTSNSHSGWGLIGARREFTRREFTDSSPCSPRDVVPDGTQGVFCPTALLRASRRIRQLDAAADGMPVGTCLGKLYTKENDDAAYKLAMRNAVFSIVRGSKGDLTDRSMSSGSSGSSQGRQFSIRVEQGSDTPYEFPISTALGIGLRDVDSIFGKEPNNKNKPKEGEALVWTSNSCEPYDAPIEEMIDDVIVLSATQDDQQEEEKDIDVTSFVFVFDGDSRQARRPSSDGAGWGPTDVLYLSRLCVLENGCHAVDGTEFAHSSATDEVLWTLFRGI